MKKELKAGDRVAVYGAYATMDRIRVTGTIEKLGVRDCWWFTPDDGRDGTNVHPKQCRRLVKKKHKEYWIRFHGCGHYAQVHHEPVQTSACCPQQIAYVREVKGK